MKWARLRVAAAAFIFLLPIVAIRNLKKLQPGDYTRFFYRACWLFLSLAFLFAIAQTHLNSSDWPVF